MEYLRPFSGFARRLRTQRPQQGLSEQGLPQRTVDLLAQPLDPALVSERELRDGRLVQYIAGRVAISQANRIFGFGGWGAEVVSEVSYRPLRLVDAADTPLAAGMYAATVRVAVPGCPAQSDVGCAFVFEETPEAHEAAYKGAVTDALKRDLRHLGDQFGNSLYGRNSIALPAPPEDITSSPSHDEATRKRLLDLATRLGVAEEKLGVWRRSDTGSPWIPLAGSR